jgi:predicted secreted protein
MKVKGSLLSALTPLLVSFGIGHAAGGVAMLTLTAADNGETVAGRVGDEIAVELSENPTTGFAWMVDPSDQEHFTLVATEFVPARGDLLGASGQRRFVFRLERAGETRLSLSLKRNWQGNSTTAADHFAIPITIDKKMAD